MFIFLYLLSVALAFSRVLTGVDCEVMDTDHPPFEYTVYGHAEERSKEGRIFQFKCGGHGCWDYEDLSLYDSHDQADYWIACGYSWLTANELDLMLDAVAIADNANTCTEDVLDYETYCGISADKDCDGSECTTIDSDKMSSLEDCKDLCRLENGCEFVTFSEYDDGNCLMYDACPAQRPYGDGHQGAITTRVCQDVTSCEKCPVGACDRNSEGKCTIYTGDKYHCYLGTSGSDCPFEDDLCFDMDGNQYLSWNKGEASLELDTCYNSDVTHCEKCPMGACDRDSEGKCTIYGGQRYHCYLGPSGTSCPWGDKCFETGGNQYLKWNEGEAILGLDTCYDSSVISGASIWHTKRVGEVLVDADCPTRFCAQVDSASECKKMCEEYDDCTVVNFQKLGSYQCCVAEAGCDWSTALHAEEGDYDYRWDILERSNTMPRVIVDVITRAWEDHEYHDHGFQSYPCGEENPGYERVAHWDPTEQPAVDSSGLGGHHYLVLCVRYDTWQQARSRAYVSDLFVSGQDSSGNGIWIGKTNLVDNDSTHECPWSYHENKCVEEDWMNFFITKAAGNVGYEGSQESAPMHYVPGIPFGGWSILYSGNGAGDSHTFTSIITSTDETSNHQERVEAFVSSSSWETTISLEATTSVTSGSMFWNPSGTKATLETSKSAHWTHSEETTDEISKAVANTLTSSLENGQEVSCTFQAPDIGGALYNTWVWKTARITYTGEITELQTCHTHVKVGPCRDQPPNCIPGYCKDQDCQDCLDEAAKIDHGFSLRPECADETSGQDDTMDCHASNFNAETDWQCCTPANPCSQDEGDCDTNEDCIGDLVCVQDAGAGYGVSQYVDVCMLSRRDNGRRRLISLAKKEQIH